MRAQAYTKKRQLRSKRGGGVTGKKAITSLERSPWRDTESKTRTSNAASKNWRRRKIFCETRDWSYHRHQSVVLEKLQHRSVVFGQRRSVLFGELPFPPRLRNAPILFQFRVRVRVERRSDVFGRTLERWTAPINKVQNWKRRGLTRFYEEREARASAVRA